MDAGAGLGRSHLALGRKARSRLGCFQACHRHPTRGKSRLGHGVICGLRIFDGRSELGLILSIYRVRGIPQEYKLARLCREAKLAPLYRRPTTRPDDRPLTPTADKSSAAQQGKQFIPARRFRSPQLLGNRFICTLCWVQMASQLR
jgi:hypothetical protein